MKYLVRYEVKSLSDKFGSNIVIENEIEVTLDAHGIWWMAQGTN